LAEEPARLKLLLDRILQPGELEQCRSHGNGLDWTLHPTWPKLVPRGRFHDQRHAHGGVIHEESVLFLPVVTEGFAVVTQHDNQAAIIKLIPLQPCYEPSQFMVGVSDLAVIKMSPVLGPIGFRWIIGAMRIVEVQPKEEWAVRVFAQPVDGMGNALGGAAIDQADVLLPKGLGGKGVVVEIEAAGQAPAAVQDEGADYGAGRVFVL